MIVDHRYDYYIACTFTNCIQHTCGRYKNLESILAASGSLALLSFLCENVLQNQNGVETSMEQGFQASHIQHKASFDALRRMWLALELSMKATRTLLLSIFCSLVATMPQLQCSTCTRSRLHIEASNPTTSATSFTAIRGR